METQKLDFNKRINTLILDKRDKDREVQFVIPIDFLKRIYNFLVRDHNRELLQEGTVGTDRSRAIQEIHDILFAESEKGQQTESIYIISKGGLL